MRTLSVFALSLVLLLLSLPASAIDSRVCLEGYTPSAPHFSLARVTGKAGDKAFFFSSDDFSGNGCPGKDSCRTRAYVIPGDEVLVDQRAAGWVCARYAGKKGQTVGWLKAEQVETLPAEAPALTAWIGTWRAGENVVEVTAGHGRLEGSLELEGHAFWHGGLKGEVVHSGRMRGATAPVGDQAVVREGPEDDSSCVVRLALLGRYLVAADNQRCGGMNVTFDGIYTKAAK